jgi:acyl dehydratase
MTAEGVTAVPEYPERTVTRLIDLAALAGHTIGVSAWRAMSQPMVDAFAEVTGDRQWIHTDPRRAADGPFGGPVVHGLLTLSAVPPMIMEVLCVEDADVVVNKGFDRIRLARPVPVGAHVRGVVRVRYARSRPRGYHEIGLSVTVEVEGLSMAALTADAVLLYHG